jgi:hypothetical protein
MPSCKGLERNNKSGITASLARQEWLDCYINVAYGTFIQATTTLKKEGEAGENALPATP